VTNIAFVFETFPNTKAKVQKVGGHDILCPPSEKVGGHVPRVPHQIVPMQGCSANKKGVGTHPK